MIAKDIRSFLRRFELTLKVLAREGRQIELEARFEDFQKLLDAWLDVAPLNTTPPERMLFLKSLDRFSGPLEISMYDIAEAATFSGDSSTAVTVASQFFHSAFACHERQQIRLMEEFLNYLSFLYIRCSRSDDLSDAIGNRLDSGLYALFTRMQSLWLGTGDEQISLEGADSSALDAMLRFALSLTNTAIRYDRMRHATYFAERIFEHRKYERPQYNGPPSSATSTESLFDYIALVLVGWSLHILQSRAGEETHAPKAVLSLAQNQLPPLPVLIAEWELLKSDEWPDATIDVRLGIHRWDIRNWNREYRAGIGEVWSGETDWMRLGLRAAILLKAESYLGNPSDYFAAAPKRFVWDAALERRELENLASNEWLAIPENLRQKRIDAAMKIIDSRARNSNAHYLSYVLRQPLSESRVAQFQADGVLAYGNNNDWMNALRACGLSAKPPTLSPLRVRTGIWVPREYLLDDNNWASGFGEHLGSSVANRETIALVRLLETIASSHEEQLDALARLPEVIRSARRRLSNSGFNPNVLILPREERFAGALFRKPLWQVEGRREFGQASIGLWEQLHVLRFPYVDPESILLIDTTSAVSEHKPHRGSNEINVWIEENPDNKEVADMKATAIAALDTADGKLPESGSIRVLAWMEASPRIAIADVHASLAIDIRGSDGGYALPYDSDFYHRPSCPDIRFDDVDYVISLPANSHRQPCPTCKPHRWNAEGRQGLIDTDDGPRGQ